MRYPSIFKLAMDILPIQASSVPCERIFSSSKETTTARRNRISPELMEELQMLKFSFKHSQDLNFTEEFNWNFELDQLEVFAKEELETPEDPRAFADSFTSQRHSE